MPEQNMIAMVALFQSVTVYTFYLGLTCWHADTITLEVRIKTFVSFAHKNIDDRFSVVNNLGLFIGF